MATIRSLLSCLRRSSSLSTLSLARQAHFVTKSSPLCSPYHHYFVPRVRLLAPFYFSIYRSFSVSSDGDSEIKRLVIRDHSATHLDAGSSGSGEVSPGVINASGEETVLPVLAVFSLLDGYHDLTGLPWWVIIASSTVALRIALLPILILQLKKLKKISELFPRLPPPFPPPLSGRSYIDQISLFRKERKAIGCPSFLWFIASFSIQVPCFLLWMTSIRRMSLDHHPGFDCGGALWFQNLTELPHGVSGSIFPFLIAGLHYINVQISFGAFSVRKETDLFGLLAKYYKLYLDLLTLPLIFIGYCIPQGSLIYWVTNSSVSVIQQLSLKHPAVRAKLGLPSRDSPTEAADSKVVAAAGIQPSDSPLKGQKISVQKLSPKELVVLSVQLLSKGHNDRAIPLLELALDKDPGYVSALVVMGQTLYQKELLGEASEYLERAISQLFLAGHPTEAEDVDLLILASQWAGVAYVRQGKMAEGVAHLERVANLEEPEEPKSKAHYFDGLVLLSSALYNEGRKAEAAKYLRLAAAYNPAYNELLEQCENDDGGFTSDLASSRRRDY